MPPYGPEVKTAGPMFNTINKWIFAEKLPAAARNGYLIVRIRLLDLAYSLAFL